MIITYHTITPEQDKTPEPIAVIQTEPIAPEIHIDTEKQGETPRTYQDVDFVPLPVPMTDTDQEIVFGICQEHGVVYMKKKLPPVPKFRPCIPFHRFLIPSEHESHFDRTARSQSGDSGYMQINDCNAERLSGLGFSDLFFI